MSVIQSYFFCFLATDNDIMRKMCTLITSKGTDMDENIANQNHATRTRTPKPGYLKLPIKGFFGSEFFIKTRIGFGLYNFGSDWILNISQLSDYKRRIRSDAHQTITRGGGGGGWQDEEVAT